MVEELVEWMPCPEISEGRGRRDLCIKPVESFGRLHDGLVVTQRSGS